MFHSSHCHPLSAPGLSCDEGSEEVPTTSAIVVRHPGAAAVPVRTTVTNTPVVVLRQPDLTAGIPGTIPGTMVRPFGALFEQWMAREEIWSQPYHSYGQGHHDGADVSVGEAVRRLI